MGVDMSISCVECVDNDTGSQSSEVYDESPSPYFKKTKDKENTNKKSVKFANHEEIITDNARNNGDIEQRSLVDVTQPNSDKSEIKQTNDVAVIHEESAPCDDNNPTNVSFPRQEEIENTQNPLVNESENISPGWGDFQTVELTDSESENDPVIPSGEVTPSPLNEPFTEHFTLEKEVSESENISKIVSQILDEILENLTSIPLPPDGTQFSLESDSVSEIYVGIDHLEDFKPSPITIESLDEPKENNSVSPPSGPSTNEPEFGTHGTSLSYFEIHQSLQHTLSSLSPNSSDDCVTPLPFSPNTSMLEDDHDDLSVISSHSLNSNHSRSTNRSTSSSHSKRLITCDHCHQNLPKHSFSALQLKKKMHRVCKMCTNGDVYVL